jgi:hypothetical protein
VCTAKSYCGALNMIWLSCCFQHLFHTGCAFVGLGCSGQQESQPVDTDCHPQSRVAGTCCSILHQIRYLLAAVRWRMCRSRTVVCCQVLQRCLYSSCYGYTIVPVHAMVVQPFISWSAGCAVLQCTEERVLSPPEARGHIGSRHTWHCQSATACALILYNSRFRGFLSAAAANAAAVAQPRLPGCTTLSEEKGGMQGYKEPWGWGGGRTLPCI